MLEERTGQQIKEILDSTSGYAPIPRYEEPAKWQELSEHPVLGKGFQKHIGGVEPYLKAPIAHVPASLYLRFARVGDRAPHDPMVGQRRSRLVSLAIAECIEREGRFLDAVLDHTWAICEESTWVPPVHNGGIPLPGPRFVGIDLTAAHTAQYLAEAVYMLGKRMDEHVAPFTERVLYEIDRRCWRPYIERADMWWLFLRPGRAQLNNWTSVCNCGVVGSALMLMEDTARLSTMIAMMLTSMNQYLQSFDRDGGSTEGAGYWTYGFSNYVWLSYLLEARTDGQLSLLDTPEVQDIARFPLRVTLSGSTVANFSDCVEKIVFPPSLLHYLGTRLDLQELQSAARYYHKRFYGEPSGLNPMDIAWMPSAFSDAPLKREAHVYFSEQHWMISRVEAEDENTLIVAAKGGHNAENHNQNDVGNFIVHYGGESLIADLGVGTYDKAYFSNKRYDNLVCNSWGHNVPLVNGQQQPPGRSYQAQLLKHESSAAGDVLEMELKEAYPPEAGLAGLRRRIALHRENEGGVELLDEIALVEPVGRCRCPLYTFGRTESSGDGTLKVIGEKAVLRIEYDPNLVTFSLEDVDLNDPHIVGTGEQRRRIQRLVFEVKIQEGKGRMVLRFLPTE